MDQMLSSMGQFNGDRPSAVGANISSTKPLILWLMLSSMDQARCSAIIHVVFRQNLLLYEDRSEIISYFFLSFVVELGFENTIDLNNHLVDE